MDNLEKTPLLDLANRLNQIAVERQKLDLEHNLIIHEIHRRFPTLENDENLQPKVISKGIKK